MLDRTAADKLTVSLMSDNGGWEITQRCHIISCWSLGICVGFQDLMGSQEVTRTTSNKYYLLHLITFN